MNGSIKSTPYALFCLCVTDQWINIHYDSSMSQLYYLHSNLKERIFLPEELTSIQIADFINERGM